MPRHVWAKVYCDLLRHPKIIGRPDSDVRLFLGLILYAKEYAPDTGTVALPPEAMRTQFGIKAPLATVKAGLSYLVTAGVLVVEGAHVRIRDFAARQKDDSSAARTRAWRERQRDGESSSQQASLPRHASSRASPEVEVEEEEEKKESLDLREEHVGANSQEPVDKSDLTGLTDGEKAQIQSLFARGKAAEATALLAKARKRSELQDNPRPEAPR